jgi:hypothetical protein
MSTESDQMMTLLQEKAMLTELDQKYATSVQTSEAKSGHLERRKRHAQISKEMLELAKIAKK